LSRALAIWAGLLAIFIIVSTILGTVHYFSPIPFEDQWDAYIGFFHGIADGQWQAWWGPQMEHRIVFSRLLFWIDGKVFGGFNIFSIVAIYALMAALCACLIYESRRALSSRWEWLTVSALVFGLMLLWTQYENFTSGFQNQFIAVYLFALLGYAQFSRDDRRGLRISIAILFGILSALSMANGLVALFVMAGQGVLLRRPLRELAAVSIVGAAVAAIYVRGQVIPVLPVDPAIAHVRLALLKFFSVFMGSPIMFLGASYLQAALLGIATLLAFGSLAACLYFKRKITPYRSFLIAGYAFVVISGLGASHGRWMLGMAAAHASRYTTPALLGYALLLLLALDVLPNMRKLILAAYALFLTCFVPIQIYALGHSDRMPYFARADIYGWRLAVLGQKIGLDHPEFDEMIFPAAIHYRFADQANYAAAANIGPYASGWLHDAGIVQFDPAKVDQTLCRGNLDAVSRDAVAFRASGWVDPLKYVGGDVLVLLTQGNQTVGYGVSGQDRPDVQKAIQGAHADTGWIGFSKTGTDLNAYAYIGGKFCKLQASN
jgi:hypothetical protein